MVKAVSTLSLEELEAELAKTNGAISKVRGEMAPLERRLKTAIERRELLNEATHKLRATDFDYVLNTIGAWAQWQKMLPRQTYGDGYFPEERQQAFKLKFKYKEAIDDELVEFIEKWLPKSKNKLMNIFRWDCGERGSWSVEFSEELGMWVCYQPRWNLATDVSADFKTVDLRAMLAYVAEHHWYEGGERPEEDYDD